MNVYATSIVAESRWLAHSSSPWAKLRTSVYSIPFKGGEPAVHHERAARALERLGILCYNVAKPMKECGCQETVFTNSQVGTKTGGRPYYRVQKVSEGSIVLANEDGLLKSKTSGTGLPLEDEKEVLSAIIQSLNERLGTNFIEMDKVLEQFVQDMAGNQEMVLRSKNPLDLFKIIYDNTIMDVVLGRMAKNQEFCEKYLEDEEFRREVDKILLPLVHERLSKIQKV